MPVPTTGALQRQSDSATLTALGCSAPHAAQHSSAIVSRYQARITRRVHAEPRAFKCSRALACGRGGFRCRTFVRFPGPRRRVRTRRAGQAAQVELAAGSWPGCSDSSADSAPRAFAWLHFLYQWRCRCTAACCTNQSFRSVNEHSESIASSFGQLQLAAAGSWSAVVQTAER